MSESHNARPEDKAAETTRVGSRDDRSLVINTQALEDMIRRGMVEFVGQTLTDAVMHVKREPGQMIEFFAYETIGAAVPHAGSVVKADDPELMKALGDAIAAGRVVMDGDTIVSGDGKPVAEKVAETNAELAVAAPPAISIPFPMLPTSLYIGPKTTFEEDTEPVIVDETKK